MEMRRDISRQDYTSAELEKALKEIKRSEAFGLERDARLETTG